MELVFQEHEMDYLEQLFHETISQEETSELIVPDSFPDVNRVVDSFGTVLVRETAASGGTTTLSGGVKAGVLYMPEGETEPQLLECYLPFTIRKDTESVGPDSRVQWTCRIKEVDARMLNSRKVLVRVGLSCRVVVYGPRTLQLSDLEQPPAGLCLKRTTVPMMVPWDTGEKTFTINDEVNLPDSAEPVDRMLKSLFRTEINETKIIGNKALFKGNIHLHTLYRSMDGNCCRFDGALPFSQYVELGQDWDEQEAQIRLSFSSAEVEPDGQMECRRLLVALNMTAQCTVMGQKEISFVEDGYDLKQTLMPEWQTLRLTGRLDTQELRDTVSGKMPVPANRLLDIWAYPTDVLQQRSGEQMNLQYGAACNVVYYDETGVLQGKIVHINQMQTVQLSPAAFCRPVSTILSEVTCLSGAEPELRCQMSLRVDSFAQQEFRCMSAATLQPPTEQPERPALILRRGQAGESLWSVAKANRTTVESLMEANGLSADTLSEEQLLLIPM